MRRLLDPTLDVVFKLLFTGGPDSDDALRSLLAAVLSPARPIASVRVLDPSPRGVGPARESFAFDLVLELHDGSSRNVQIQARAEGTSRNSVLHDWATLHGGQREPGMPFAKLRPTVSILLLNHRELPGERLHSIFRVLERDDRTPLSDGFEMHVVELPKLDDVQDEGEPALRAWARFFTATTDEDVADAASRDPGIRKAQAILERLSADPCTQHLARQRALAKPAPRSALR